MAPSSSSLVPAAGLAPVRSGALHSSSSSLAPAAGSSLAPVRSGAWHSLPLECQETVLSWLGLDDLRRAKAVNSDYRRCARRLLTSADWQARHLSVDFQLRQWSARIGWPSDEALVARLRSRPVEASFRIGALRLPLHRALMVVPARSEEVVRALIKAYPEGVAVALPVGCLSCTTRCAECANHPAGGRLPVHLAAQGTAVARDWSRSDELSRQMLSPHSCRSGTHLKRHVVLPTANSPLGAPHTLRQPGRHLTARPQHIPSCASSVQKTQPHISPTPTPQPQRRAASGGRSRRSARAAPRARVAPRLAGAPPRPTPLLSTCQRPGIFVHASHWRGGLHGEIRPRVTLAWRVARATVPVPGFRQFAVFFAPLFSSRLLFSV